MQNFSLENPKGRDHFEDISIDRKHKFENPIKLSHKKHDHNKTYDESVEMDLNGPG
jgi:hypothetical protein